MTLDALEADVLRRVLRALGNHRSEFVIVGGWAHRPMRRHEAANTPPHQPLLTLDLDLAGPSRLGDRSSTTLSGALKAEGFAEDFRTEDRPPVTHYLLDHPRFQLEFIAPLQGSGRRRDGTSLVTESLLGVSAQLIRYLEVLRDEPWIAMLPEIGPGAEVQVANPVSYIFQKLLSAPNRRERSKEAKDLLYIYDTIVLFSRGVRLNEKVVEQSRRLRQRLPSKAATLMSAHRRRYFEAECDPLREAARIASAAGRSPLAPRELLAVCRSGLSELID